MSSDRTDSPLPHSTVPARAGCLPDKYLQTSAQVVSFNPAGLYQPGSRPTEYLPSGAVITYQPQERSMYFDWVTWSIWALGLIILIVWIYVPAKEFRQLLKERRERLAAAGKSPEAK